jgi:hypothetical protein
MSGYEQPVSPEKLHRAPVAAEVSNQGLFDLVVGWMKILLQSCFDHRGQAGAALASPKGGLSG